MGLASLILGIIGLLISLTFFKDLSLILTILGIVLGIIAIIKKKTKGIAIAGIVLSALGLILCFLVDTNNSTNGTGITNDSGNGKSTVSVTTEKVKVEKVGLTKAGDLVVKVTNNNKGSVCLSSITANFKDSSGNFALKKEAESSYVVIPAESYTLVYFWGFDENYSQYPEVSFKTELANISDDFAATGIKISSNNTGSQIAVSLKNNSGKTINSSSVVVIYYKDNEVVGAETGYDNSTVSNGSESYINVDYPEDSNYDNVSFDNFEVYYVNASFE